MNEDYEYKIGLCKKNNSGKSMQDELKSSFFALVPPRFYYILKQLFTTVSVASAGAR